MKLDFNQHPHRRFNILTGEWVLVSSHRTKRPRQGKQELVSFEKKPSYDEKCYLCPGNTRANGVTNPNYGSTYSFINDFSALNYDSPSDEVQDGLLKSKGEIGICRVVCFSPDHSLTLPLMTVADIEDVISLWQKEYLILGNIEGINHVQIFENKGDIMRCSNPHPHGQIWSQSSIPKEVIKKTNNQAQYWYKHNESLLGEYIKQEIVKEERILFSDEYFIALIPYWAVWPYEVMIVPIRHILHIGQLSKHEKNSFARMIRKVTIKLDNLFEISFPYSMGIHQAPTNDLNHDEWHFHMSFYPPLLRSATVKKFMVGYELFADPQRDLSAEQAAHTLNGLSEIHFSQNIMTNIHP